MFKKKNNANKIYSIYVDLCRKSERMCTFETNDVKGHHNQMYT